MRSPGNTKNIGWSCMHHFLVSLFIMGCVVSLTGTNLLADSYEESISIVIQYGSQEGQIGFVDEDEVPKLGPSSFTNDSEGNLYICDTVNRRIQVHDRHGTYQRMIPLKTDITPIDIVVDDSNHLFVYDHPTRQLHQVSRNGSVVVSVQFDSKKIPCINSMHMVGGNIYRRTCNENDMILGSLINERLVQADEATQMRNLNRGVIAPSNRRYALELLRGKKGAIYLHGNNQLNSRKKLKDLDIAKPLSLKFLKEDKDGNFYLQTERLVGKAVVLEVRKFNSSGELLSILPIKDTDYAAWPINLVSVDNEGRVWQLVPGDENARLHVFSPLSK